MTRYRVGSDATRLAMMRMVIAARPDNGGHDRVAHGSRTGRTPIKRSPAMSHGDRRTTFSHIGLFIAYGPSGQYS